MPTYVYKFIDRVKPSRSSRRSATTRSTETAHPTTGAVMPSRRCSCRSESPSKAAGSTRPTAAVVMARVRRRAAPPPASSESSSTPSSSRFWIVLRDVDNHAVQHADAGS